MENYYKYLTLSTRDQVWGLSVLNTGCTRILPNQAYPFKNHPYHHNFNWLKGRILQEYQLIYIPNGEGLFETASLGVQKVTAGTVILLFPGERHRYKPSGDTGWDEYWVGFKGPIADRLRHHKFISPEKSSIKIGFDTQLLNLLLEIIEHAKTEKAGYQLLISGIVFHLLGHLQVARQHQYFEGKDVELLVAKAKIIFRENLYQSITPAEVAQELGIGYSWFRKAFKNYTGIAPGQYLIQLKTQKAKELLLSPTLSIKEIAYKLRFDSCFYFSRLFKEKTGLTPAEYRKQH